MSETVKALPESIEIGGKTLRFAFDTQAWVDVEKEFASIDAMYERMARRLLPMTTGLKLAAITATAALREEKSKAVVTFEWLVEHARPSEVRTMIAMAKEAVVRAMPSDDDEDEDTPIDVGLAEEKKETADA